MTQKLKNRAPLWLWVIFFAIIIVVPVLAVLQILGIVNLSFLAEWFLGYFAWGSQNLINAGLAFVLPIGIGALIGYGYVHIRGMKINRNTVIEGNPTVLQGAPIQTQAFQAQPPAPIIQPIDDKEKQ